jgi:hypothetical protein
MDPKFDPLTHLIDGIAEAVSGRAGETPERRDIRRQTAVQAIHAFQPRDAIEAMIAGHCVVFHELIVDSVGRSLRGEDEPSLRASRGNIVAMDKAFGDNLTRLERYRREQPAEAATETEIADRVIRHQAEAPAMPASLNRQARRAMARKGIGNVMPTRSAPATTISATGAG